jgi:hypothetical protein
MCALLIYFFHFIVLILSEICPKFVLIDLFCLEKRPSSPFMIDLPRLKAVGAELAFGYAIVKDCDKRFQAHCRRRPAQVAF